MSPKELKVEIVSTSKDGVIGRYSKTRKPEDYLASEGTTRRGWRELDREDRIGEFMLGALRLSEGFTGEEFRGMTGVPFEELSKTLEQLVEQGLLCKDVDHIRVSPLGLRYLDDVVNAFFA